HRPPRAAREFAACGSGDKGKKWSLSQVQGRLFGLVPAARVSCSTASSPSTCRSQAADHSNGNIANSFPSPRGYRPQVASGSAVVELELACHFGAGNSTVGASSLLASVTSKYSRESAPITFAVNTCGKRRVYVLYACTAWLYSCRATATRFSVPASSSCNRRKFSLDLSSG